MFRFWLNILVLMISCVDFKGIGRNGKVVCVGQVVFGLRSSFEMVFIISPKGQKKGRGR